MKKDIHPEKKAVLITMNDGTQYTLMMALPNGAEKLILEVDPTTHPAWKEDGSAGMIINKAGQASKFDKKFSGIF